MECSDYAWPKRDHEFFVRLINQLKLPIDNILSINEKIFRKLLKSFPGIKIKTMKIILLYD